MALVIDKISDTIINLRIAQVNRSCSSDLKFVDVRNQYRQLITCVTSSYYVIVFGCVARTTLPWRKTSHSLNVINFYNT